MKFLFRVGMLLFEWSECGGIAEVVAGVPFFLLVNP